MPVASVTLVDEPGAQAPALRRLGDLPVVGVDVERADWDRYFRAAALVQLGGQGRVVLIDPLGVDDLSPLQRYLADRVAVFHACENDLGPLADRGVRPPRIEDTAVAAALLGLPTGLGTLLAGELGVELSADKAAMQRAAWEARPLTPEMLAYAAEDVADLPALWAALSQGLDRLGRRDWYRQELAAVLARPSVEQRRAWTRVKGSGRLDEAARRRLRALWQAREDAARRTDTAPARVAADRVLLDLASRPPARAAELPRRGMRRQAARQFGGALLAAVRQADGTAAASSPAAAVRVPTDRDRALADRLRALRGERARALGLDPGVLCPSRTLTGALLTDPRTPGQLRDALGLRPWQWQQVGDAFCGALGLTGPGRPERAPRPPKEKTMADLLDADTVRRELEERDGWAGGTDGITRTYRFRDFVAAMGFLQRVALLSERASHHPDVELSYGTVTLTIRSHAAGGVTRKCLDLADSVDEYT